MLVLHDTPGPAYADPGLRGASTRPTTPTCDGKPANWIPPEPADDAVQRVADPAINFLDLNRPHLRGETCAAVNGGVITYFDTSHLTATYAKTLAPYLGSPLAQLLRTSTAGG